MAEAAGLADADDDDDPVCDDDDPVVSEYFRTIKRGRVDEVKRLLLDEGNSLNPGIRTWLRSRAGRAFWLRVMSCVDMSAP